MMRFSLITLFLAWLLSGCGSDQPEISQPATVPPQPAVAQESEVQAETQSADDEAQPEMVEESAAQEEEVDTGDQPIVLAQAEPPEPPAEWQFDEGTHYTRLVPAQPTVGGADKIEVAEIFWYGCNHCYDFEAFINPWKEDIPANVRFVRIPAIWNPLVRLHAQLYYTEEVLSNNGKLADPATFRAAVFAEYHRRGNRMASVEAIQEIFEKHGVSAEDFDTTWNSFEVSQKMRVAQDLGRRYQITGVPAIVVNGKYRTGSGEAGGYPRLLELIEELIVRESIR
jgi:thiol:disulfide interchange protein DsbA